MPNIGPTLPPNLASTSSTTSPSTKRKRSTSSSSSSSPPHKTPSAPRILGPSLPPAPLSERPPASPTPSNSSSDDSDSDLGPALPSSSSPQPSAFDAPSTTTAPTTSTSADPTRPKREEWMLAPPSAGELSFSGAGASRIDTTKLKSRRFNASSAKKSTAGPGEASTWTETAEQKRQRLENAVLGISNSNTGGAGTGAPTNDEDAEARKKRKEEERETKRRVAAFNTEIGGRGRSLVEEHKGRKGRDDEEEEDDPSARAFDREKDMRSGKGIGHKGRKEMVGRAGVQLGGKFQGGGFL